MWWQSPRKQLEAVVNGALSVSLLYSMPIPLFLSGDTAITLSFLFAVLHSPPTVFFTIVPTFHLSLPLYFSKRRGRLISHFIIHLSFLFPL